MDDEILRLQRLLQDEQRQRKEADRQREEADRQRADAEDRLLTEQRQREDEQKRRESAEERAKEPLPQTIQQYLEACHLLSLAIQPVINRSSTTQGETTNPTGRIYPKRIVPWDNFAAEQEGLEYVTSLIRPISSELGLRDFERDTVENAVRKLVEGAYEDEALRSRLGLQGVITFESHTNLGDIKDSISAPLEHMSIGSGTLALTSQGRNVPAVAIEYKPPHKLTRDEIVTGLDSEIQPERDTIHKHGDGFAFASRTLVAAVVTQLFSYMIGKGIQYGYVCTGEAFIFLSIPDDPTIVYYSVCVPDLDVVDGDETRLHRTAVAQVFAFILQAIGAEPPPASWHDTAAGLDLWAVEYDDVLRDIPVTVRKEKRGTPYKPQRWKGFQRSPIRTRSGCKQPGSDIGPRNEDDNDSSDDDKRAHSPTPNQPRRSGRNAATSEPQPPSTKQGRGQQSKGQVTKPKIQDRPFCTQQCLLGLAYGGPVDDTCPNYHSHGRKHIDRLEFLGLIRNQLAKDRGRDADCVPLYLGGSLGALFKVRLSSHGYTLVAKGMEALDLGRLQHEGRVYDRLKPIQGKHVPVCLGMINLALPYYYDSGVFGHFLFLSWAGQPLFECTDQIGKADILQTATQAYVALHKSGVLHCDAELRNMLYDERSGCIMVVDFERAQLPNRQPLGLISLNRQTRKRKRGVKCQGVKNLFTQELHLVSRNVSRWINMG
ncbi:Uu.00g130360.m01.CDS01 [Anthostomella pinea]|uniref:Uu.00g130360.m01.CDS01 n=1 Tax=Anthostomella pinea TaxID=933095 RepID=A0AAI8YIA3_9PEZI|nr:Uu.00g130360.m01.CDS01 [Anthostomella pinea]